MFQILVEESAEYHKDGAAESEWLSNDGRGYVCAVLK